MLKQPLHSPYSLHEQVILLMTAVNKLMNDIDPSDVRAFSEELLQFFDREHGDLALAIENEKALSDELKDAILAAAREFVSFRAKT